MVEAVGIEPTSKSFPQQTLHACLILIFTAWKQLRSAEWLPQLSPSAFLGFSLEKTEIPKSLLNWRFTWTAGWTSEAATFITQRVLTDYWQLCVLIVGLTRDQSPSACTYYFKHSRRSLSPPITFIVAKISILWELFLINCLICIEQNSDKARFRDMDGDNIPTAFVLCSRIPIPMRYPRERDLEELCLICQYLFWLRP